MRNNYFQPAMSELMAACVEVWESDPEAFHYHRTGYIALGPPAQESDLIAVFERQQKLGYSSELHVGEQAVGEHMRSLYEDWRAPGLTVCLHEHRGGYAFNRESMLGLADKARAAGDSGGAGADALFVDDEHLLAPASQMPGGGEAVHAGPDHQQRDGGGEGI